VTTVLEKLNAKYFDTAVKITQKFYCIEKLHFFQGASFTLKKTWLMRREKLQGLHGALPMVKPLKICSRNHHRLDKDQSRREIHLLACTSEWPRLIDKYTLF